MSSAGSNRIPPSDRPRLPSTNVVPIGGRDADELLLLTAAVEQASEHPLARAIVAAARRSILEPDEEKQPAAGLPAVADFDAPAGKGVLGTVEGHRVAIGTAGFLHSQDVHTDALAETADDLRGSGATAVLVAIAARMYPRLTQ